MLSAFGITFGWFVLSETAMACPSLGLGCYVQNHIEKSFCCYISPRIYSISYFYLRSLTSPGVGSSVLLLCHFLPISLCIDFVLCKSAFSLAGRLVMMSTVPVWRDSLPGMYSVQQSDSRPSNTEQYFSPAALLPSQHLNWRI